MFTLVSINIGQYYVGIYAICECNNKLQPFEYIQFRLQN